MARLASVFSASGVSFRSGAVATKMEEGRAPVQTFTSQQCEKKRRTEAISLLTEHRHASV